MPMQHIKDDYNPRTSEYEIWDHRQEAALSTRDANISESNPQYSNTSDPRAIRELNPQVLTDNPTPTHMSDISGIYVDRIESRYESGQQHHLTNANDLKTRGFATMKNAWPSPLEWAIDVYNIGMNWLLEKPIEEYKESLKQEF